MKCPACDQDLPKKKEYELYIYISKVEKERDQLRQTLRDKFAMNLVPTILSEFFTSMRNKEVSCPEDWMVGVSIDTYRLADAMLDVRLK